MFRGFALFAVFALSACATDAAPSETPARSAPSEVPGQLWVAVTGPADSEGPEDLVLEIGDTAWFGYGGVISVETQSALDVRLVGRESCRSYAGFEAPAGTKWVIRFADDGTVGVEDWTGRLMDLGPALGEREPSGCPASYGDLATVQPATPSSSVIPTSSPPPGYVSVEELPLTVLANEAADALFGGVETCVSEAGYTVRFPATWYTNPATGDWPACSWFAPEPFDVSVNAPPPDDVWISMGVVDGVVGYTSITPIYMTEELSIAGYEGHRAEFGPSTLDEIESRPEYRAYHYVMPFEEFGATFAAGTDVDSADDYTLAKAVLDRIMATISFER